MALVTKKTGVDLSKKADLVNGLVPSSQLPSYVDDVIEVTELPATGETGKIYVRTTDNTTWRRTGSTFIAFGVIDGDKGDITVSNSGTTWTIDTGLDASKIANGSVSNTEFQYLDGVTSSIQTQINAKQNTIPAFDANRVLFGDGTNVPVTNSGFTFNTSTGLNVTNNAVNITINPSSGSSVSYIGNYSNHPVAFVVDNTEQMRLTNTNMLVGLPSALANGKLQVAGGIGLSGNTQIRQATNGDGNTLQVFATQVVVGALNSLSYGYSGGGLLASVSNSANAITLDVGANSPGHRLVVVNGDNGSSGYLNYSHSGVSRFYVDSSTGNVGLGTTNVPYRIVADSASSSHIVSFFRSSFLSSGRYYASSLIGYSNVANQSAQFGYVYDPTTIANSFAHITPWGYGEGSVFAVRANGNVGIGTSNPTAKLDVIGDVKINSLTVGLGGGQIASNTAIGYSSLVYNTTGSQNTANGMQALNSNTTGNYNTASGVNALFSNTTGSQNTANGVQALNSNTTGNYNTASGVNALYDLTTGSYNTALGYNTGRGITTGSNNTILGANVTGLSSNLSNNIIIADGSGNRRVNIDANGNLGLGVTPSGHLPSGFGGPMFQIGNRASILGSSVYSTITNNVYYASGYYRYIATDTASMFEQAGGAFRWFTAPSGSVGNGINFTQVMTLDASSNLGIGTSTPAQKLHVAVSAGVSNAVVSNVSDIGGGVLIRSISSGINSRVGLFLQGADQIGSAIASAREDIGTSWSTYMAFYTNNVTGNNTTDLQEKMRLSGGGNLGIGTANPLASLHIGNNTSTGNYILVQGSNSTDSYDVFRGERKYPRFTLLDTVSGGSEFNLWNLGSQLRIGTNTGAVGTASFVVNAGDAASVNAIGNMVIGDTNTFASTRAHIKGIGATSSTNSFVVHNSTGSSNSLVVRDDGNICFGGAYFDSKVTVHAEGAGTGLNGVTTTMYDTTTSLLRVSRFATQLLGSGTARTLFYAASSSTDGASGDMVFFTENGSKGMFRISKHTTGDSEFTVFKHDGNSLFTFNGNGLLQAGKTTAEINAISSPADGLEVFNTTLGVKCQYSTVHGGWIKYSHSAM